MTANNEPKPEGMTEFFDTRAEGYDAHMEFGTEELDTYFGILAEAVAPSDDPVRILDLGCGTGEELKWIFARVPNARVTGIDMSPGMLGLLREKYPDKAGQIGLMVGSYTELDLGSGEYDYAVSSFTIHHLTHDAKRGLYTRIRRCLKPGGTYIEGDYIIATMEEEEAHLRSYQEIMAGVEDPGALYHIDIPFTSETQVRLFTEAGFMDVRVLYDNDRNNAILAGRA